ncbi:MAG: DUF1624 domain-containing protein [Candidatus Anstonellaceae archaeon]
MRIEQVDILRGVGIFLVILYHFFYALYFFGFSNINPNTGFLLIIGRLAASIMVFVVGMSLTLSYVNASKTNSFFSLTKKYLFRSLKLFAVAFFISIISYIFYPEGWIRWGIIHFIALAVFVCSFFARFYYFNLVAGFYSILFGFLINPIPTNNFFLFILGFHLPIYSLDYFAFFPWVGLVFLGMYSAKRLYLKKDLIEQTSQKTTILAKENNNITSLISKYFILMGQNTLLLYLIHVPIFVSILLFIKKFL